MRLWRNTWLSLLTTGVVLGAAHAVLTEPVSALALFAVAGAITGTGTGFTIQTLAEPDPPAGPVRTRLAGSRTVLGGAAASAPPDGPWKCRRGCCR